MTPRIQNKAQMLSRAALKVLEKPSYPFRFHDVGKKEKKNLFPLSVGIAVAMIFIYRIFLAARAPLTGDEAYYWLWAKHLALGYHDHPPLIGWLVAAATVFSNRVLWVRLPALICSLGSACFFYVFARDFLGSSRRAGLALMFFLFLPILAIASVAVFPDAPLILSWTFCLWAGWKSLRDQRYWPLTGLAVGLGILSKLMGLFLPASLVLFFALNRKARFWLTQKSFWIGVTVAMVVSSPVWIWNARHHFENFLFQARDHLSVHPVHPLLSFLGYVGLQSVSVTPFLFILFVPVLYSLVKKSWRGDARSQFLLAFFAPIHLFFAVMAFRTDAGIHWAVPGYLSLLVACAGMDGWERLKSLSLANCVAFSILFYAVFGFPVITAWAIQPLNRAFPAWGVNHFLQGKDYGELFGYRELAGSVKERLDGMLEKGPVFLLTDSYNLSSVLAYYMRRPTSTLLLDGQGAQYSRWDRFEQEKGEKGLWVSLSPLSLEPDVRRILQKAFKAVGAEKPIAIRSGPVVRTFYCATLYHLRNPEALRTNVPGIR